MTSTEAPSRSEYRSVSQYGQYKKCPYSYYLQRRARAWQKPAAWLGQGTAVHKALEVWEESGRTMTLEEAQRAYKKAFEDSVNESLQDTPNTDYWFSSGPYTGDLDIERRFQIGLGQVGRLIRFLGKQRDEVIWIDPDGSPGLEMGFDLDLDGVRVKGFIDRVVELEPGLLPGANLSVDDLKSGNEPGEAFQLGTYKVAVEDKYPGVRVTQGRYLMAGKASVKNAKYVHRDISEYSKYALTEEYHWLDESIRAERFDPKPSEDNCRMCSVASSCEFAVK